jgi:hypothetical protein
MGLLYVLVSLNVQNCTSDLAQAAPRYLPGSFQYEYEDIAGAQGEGPLLGFPLPLALG